MHALQPRITKLKKEEVENLLKKYNISLFQLPKIFEEDPSLPEGVKKGDVIKIERKIEEEIEIYYRVVI
ncbi:MAG: DNA-directed RNA polymerase subunit RpoH/Rpb5 C-terminal domain-containing protein [Candidatus Pacearchaeota archaeon]